MIEFEIQGPFEIPFTKGPGGRIVHWDEFWRTNEIEEAEVKGAKGVYVFAWRASKGYTPWYVGSATKTFGQEATSDRNQKIYLEIMSGYKSGTPVLFFVVHPAQRGKANRKAILEIEDFLIPFCAKANKALKNVHGNRAPSWRINGFIRSRQGPRPIAARRFVRCVGNGF